MERQPQHPPRRSPNTSRALEGVLQAVRHARAGRLEALEAQLSDLIGRVVTLQVDAPEERSEASSTHAQSVPSTTQVDVSFLPPRMATVLRLIVAGQSDKEIAEALGVSHTTARTYVRRLCRSLHVSGRRGIHLWVQRRTKLGHVESL
jgi:DNA-binding NarL/FixJ family response regulator